MEKDNRKVKVIAIMALLVAIAGVSIGFAAFTRTLTITSQAEVNPVDDFNVVFSNQANAVSTTGGVDASSKTPADLVTTNAVIDNSAQGGPTITNLKATFTQPGQSATYTFYVYNDSDYIAYLKNVDFTAASTKCTIPSGSQVTQALMNSACNDINVKITIGNDVNTTNLSADTAVSSHSLAAGASELVTVVISYDTVTSQVLADGPFEVDLGTIQLLYKTVDE